MWTRFAGVVFVAGLGASAWSPTAAVAAQHPPLGFAVLAVVACPTSYGVTQAPPWQPTKLPVALTQHDAARLAFYSNGFVTVLGPRGWGCQAVAAADGSKTLEVSPPGSAAAGSLPDPNASWSVYAAADYTGHGPGALLVCPYFPGSGAAKFFGGGPPACPALPAGTTMTSLTPDTVFFRLPNARSGIVLYPQITPEPRGGVSVALETCRLPGNRASLCTAILHDYAVRSYPIESSP